MFLLYLFIRVCLCLYLFKWVKQDVDIHCVSKLVLIENFVVETYNYTCEYTMLHYLCVGIADAV